MMTHIGIFDRVGMAKQAGLERGAFLGRHERSCSDLMRPQLLDQRLGITERTVKAHLTSAYQRIGVADRTQAALWAQRHDLGGSANG